MWPKTKRKGRPKIKDKMKRRSLSSEYIPAFCHWLQQTGMMPATFISKHDACMHAVISQFRCCAAI